MQERPLHQHHFGWCGDLWVFFFIQPPEKNSTCTPCFGNPKPATKQVMSKLVNWKYHYSLENMHEDLSSLQSITQFMNTALWRASDLASNPIPITGISPERTQSWHKLMQDQEILTHSHHRDKQADYRHERVVRHAGTIWSPSGVCASQSVPNYDSCIGTTVYV